MQSTIDAIHLLFVSCATRSDCKEPVTHIDRKGYVYCERHGRERKEVQRSHCRRMKPAELESL